MIWVQATTHSSEVFSMDPITFTVTPRGSDQAITIDLSALLTQLQTVPDQRKRRGVRYPLAVLLAIATECSRARMRPRPARPIHELWPRARSCQLFLELTEYGRATPGGNKFAPTRFRLPRSRA